MTWSTVTSPTGTWSGAARSVVSWTTSQVGATAWPELSRSNHPPAWVQVASVNTAFGNGVNFNCRITASYPMVICDDRPWPIVTEFAEGAP